MNIPNIKLIRFNALWRHRNVTFGITARLRTGWQRNHGSIPSRSTWL